jgi:hypothetical protein
MLSFFVVTRGPMLSLGSLQEWCTGTCKQACCWAGWVGFVRLRNVCIPVAVTLRVFVHGQVDRCAC